MQSEVVHYFSYVCLHGADATTVLNFATWNQRSVQRREFPIAAEQIGGGKPGPHSQAPVPVDDDWVPLHVQLLLQRQSGVLEVPQAIFGLGCLQL